ncbi:Dabb family protein [Anaerofustis sp.]|uniref:Dabb family protein n=1 Tax=Anaerofustis sp. TaxID=1872517 RepID=UPI0025C27C40|nr:Dabb family protein [Anaerofustis sp.]
MIKHIVCFKLKDSSDKSCKMAKETLMSMENHVDVIKDIKVGIDFLHSDRSYDIILEVILNNKEDLDIYQNDHYHVDVVKSYMHKVRESSISVDYVID